jgi:hypothetical protein
MTYPNFINSLDNSGQLTEGVKGEFKAVSVPSIFKEK